MITAARPVLVSDEELFASFRSRGDAPAFESLVHRYEHELFGYLRRFLHSAEMAEDVFQATFLQVHLKRDSFADGRLFRPWLYAIATHRAIDAQRRNKRHRMVELDRRHGDGPGQPLVAMLAARVASADQEAEREEARQEVRSAIGCLSGPQRLVLELVYQRGLKYADVARRVGIPVGTVKSRVRAALIKLGATLRRTAAPEHGGVRLAARGLAT